VREARHKRPAILVPASYIKFWKRQKTVKAYKAKCRSVITIGGGLGEIEMLYLMTAVLGM
jgi:hypothetical protein